MMNTKSEGFSYSWTSINLGTTLESVIFLSILSIPASILGNSITVSMRSASRMLGQR